MQLFIMQLGEVNSNILKFITSSDCEVSFKQNLLKFMIYK